MLAGRRALRLVCFALCAHALHAHAHAQDAHEVALRVPDCLGASGAEIEKLVALELAPRMHVVEDGAARADVLTGTVECADPRAIIAVDDPARASALRVEIDLVAAAPKARERLVALALAELIMTSQLEGAAAQPPAPPAPPPEPEGASSDSEEPEPPRDSFQLWVAPSISLAGDPAAPLVGGDLGAARVLGPLLLSFDLRAQLGRSDRSASEVSVRVLSACVGVAPLLLRRHVQLSVGAGMRIGHVMLSGSAQRPNVAGDELSAFWLGPAALAALHVPLAGLSALRVALEAGYVARPVVGVDERARDRMALRGVWLSTAIGLALHMP